MATTKRKAKPKPKARRTVGDRLRKIGACKAACRWADKFTSAQKAWDACGNYLWMKWLLIESLECGDTPRAELRTAFGEGGELEYGQPASSKSICCIYRKHFPKPPKVSK